MLRLMLLRHAKAVAHRDIGDHGRGLAPRGVANARALGRDWSHERLLPDLALISDARRTRETWDALQRGWPELESVAAEFEPALYLASAPTLLQRVQSAAASARHVLLLGHNPGLAELAMALVGFGDRYALARMAQKFPTCGLAVLDFDAPQWQLIGPCSGRLDRFTAPADADMAD